MIHFRCIYCQRELNAEDNRGGQGVICPRCKARVTVPAQSENETAGGRGSCRADGPDAAQHELPGAPRRVRRRPLAWLRDRFWAQLLVGCILALVPLALGTALEITALILVTCYIGLAMCLGSLVWFLYIAFNDRPLRGFFCLVVPFYALYYLCANFAETKRPFFTYLAGAGVVAAALLAGGWAPGQ